MPELLVALLRDNPVALAAILTPIAVGIVALLFPRLSRAQQDQLLGATKGAYNVVAAVAASTPWPIDDALASILRQVEQEMGRQLKPKERQRVEGIALGLLADPSRPDIVSPTERSAVLRKRINGAR